ncbi:MAG: DUF2911 domain-containing protein [Cyclobacteriaceae bacterium]|nr:DUF2911 domain-containing protein [Cyclobacteriaceae bacterium]
MLAIVCYGQDATPPRPSPMAVASVRYKDSYVKVVYSQPQKKGRDVFGALVPFGQVWRAGANEATEITLTRDIKINDQDLKAGTYSVFTIPEKEKWTVIINSDQGLWGAYNYNPKMDVLRIDVPVQSLAGLVYEPFTIWFDPKNDKADLLMAWDKSRITLSIQFSEPKQ